ncbi:hypothetical protein BDA99DRAFT_195734 [Phascolomyces articulosus]|uniref:Uncharacterized protein n=1 Tax=Phascolomyces articulosus TaxID=60185 RepID=A0AAD5KUB5_9FUNG|nr:hypothetical protein BDA99DRAFT_195734 [Phascolomyces articulosus]
MSIMGSIMLLMDFYKKKYEQEATSGTDDDSNTSLADTNTDTPSASANNTDTSPAIVSTRVSSSTNRRLLAESNWKFVQDYLDCMKDEEAVNWNVIYTQGKDQGLFINYTKALSMKRAYYHMKSQTH